MNILDSGFSEQTIELIRSYDNVEDINALFDAILEMDVNEYIMMQPLVDECFIAIENFLAISEYIGEQRGKNAMLPYIQKAIDVLDALMNSRDFDERSEATAYINEEDWVVNTSDYNYMYATTLISDVLEKVFPLNEEQSHEVLSFYKQVIKPVFSKIKSITVDEVVFDSLIEAQIYINNKILKTIGENHIDNFDIKMVLSDEYELEEIRLKLDNIFDEEVNLKNTSLIGCILYNLDADERWFRDHYVEDHAFESYSIELNAYKNIDMPSFDLQFLHTDVHGDIIVLLSKSSRRFNALIQDIRQEEQMAVLLELLERSYKNDLQKLKYEIRIIELLIARKDIGNTIPNVLTRKLENKLPEIPFQDKDIFIQYIELKILTLHNIEFQRYLRMVIDNIVNNVHKYDRNDADYYIHRDYFVDLMQENILGQC